MTSTLLGSYVKQPDFENVIHQIYDAVCCNDLVKHYFVLAKKNTVVQDLRRFWPYLTSKTPLDYRRPATPTASSDIQLPDAQFSELIEVMTRVFREWKFNPEHVPQLTHEILELIEESRSQTNDTLSSRLEAKEVTPDKILYFLKRYKISAEVMPSKAIMAERGLSHKLWLRIDAAAQEIQLEGRIAIADTAFNDQIDEVLERLAGRDSSINLQLEHDDAGRRRLLARRSLPYRHGIPMRLFARYLRRFSTELDQVHECDREDILRSA